MTSEKEFQEIMADIDPHTDCYKHPNFFIAYIHKKRLKLLYKLIKKSKGKKLIDVGCGDGFVLDYLKPLNKKLYGIDISEKRVKRVKKMVPDAKIKLCSADNISYKDNFFDITLCSEVLEHVRNPVRSIKELIRITKKNGIIIITVPNEFNVRICRLLLLKFPLKIADHLNNFSVKQLDKLFGRKHTSLITIPNLSRFLAINYILIYIK